MAQCPKEGATLIGSQKVLIVRFSAIGDCVMTAWAGTALRNVLPDAEIVWACQDTSLAVIDNEQLTNQVVVADQKAWRSARWSPQTWQAQMRGYLNLRKHHFHVGFDFQGHSKTALCLKLSGAKSRFASRGTDGFASRLNHVVECGAGKLHEVEVGLNLVRHAYPEAILPNLPYMPPLQVSQAYDITIQTGAGEERKQVKVTTWEAVARELTRLGKSVAILGAPGDPEFDVPGVDNLVGAKSLSETMSLVGRSKLHLSADTGTGHIASAYNIPTVTVFGHNLPERFRPFGQKNLSLRETGDPKEFTAQEIIDATFNHWEAMDCGS